MGMTKDVFDEYGNYKYPDYSNSQYTNYATATGGKMGMTIDKAILRIEHSSMSVDDKETADFIIDTMRKYQQLEDFARWVAVEVIDEELWTYNYLSFAELACRKLVRLGIMQESDGEYSYEVVEDGNDA